MEGEGELGVIKYLIYEEYTKSVKMRVLTNKFDNEQRRVNRTMLVAYSW